MKWARALVIIILILILVGFRSGQIEREKIAEEATDIKHNDSTAAAITSTASVPPNPVNSALEEILVRENELSKREQAISQTEKARNAASLDNTTLAIIILFIMLVINFTFDYKRASH